MRMKNNRLLILIISLLFIFTCDKDKGLEGIPPSPPDWLDVKLSFEKLPGYMESAELKYEITIIGDDSAFRISEDGDTLDHLWMTFKTSDWCEGINADADTLFDDRVNISQKIVIKPVFQLTKDNDPQWTYIDLRWGFYSITYRQVPLDSIIKSEIGGHRLFFNHHTKEYSFP